jgi:hypothetical protein
MRSANCAVLDIIKLIFVEQFEFRRSGLLFWLLLDGNLSNLVYIITKVLSLRWAKCLCYFLTCYSGQLFAIGRSVNVSAIIIYRDNAH